MSASLLKILVQEHTQEDQVMLFFGNFTFQCRRSSHVYHLLLSLQCWCRSCGVPPPTPRLCGHFHSEAGSKICSKKAGGALSDLCAAGGRCFHGTCTAWLLWCRAAPCLGSSKVSGARRNGWDSGFNLSYRALIINLASYCLDTYEGRLRNWVASKQWQNFESHEIVAFLILLGRTVETPYLELSCSCCLPM